jgi:hypothetical protein
MTYRTKTGKSLSKSGHKSHRKSGSKTATSAAAHLGSLTWAFALLMVSVALAAAAVFTHKP